LLICDEIHYVYNTKEKNNWGVALQAILDHEPSLRALFMTATPINNSASEVVDIANLLLPPKERLTKKEIFADNKLTEKGKQLLIKTFKGRVTYLRNIDPDIFPSREFVGKSIDNCKYLKFVRVPLTEPQLKEYNKHIKNALSITNRHLLDFAFPHPTDSHDHIFRSSDIKILNEAPEKWKEKNEIRVDNGVITGDILRLETLQKYANKMTYLLETVRNLIKNKGGKILITDNTIYMSGVLFIEQCLLKNGFVNDTTIPTEGTLCVICGETLKSHKIKGGAGTNADSKGDMGEIEYEIKEDVISINKISDADHFNLSKLMKDYPNHKIYINHENKKHYAVDENNLLFNDEVVQFLYENKVEIKDELTNVEAFYDENNNLKLVRVNDVTYKKTCGGTTEIVGGKPVPIEHEFVPAKFFVVHSMVPKKMLERQLDEFNYKDNVMGKLYCIIIGAEMIQQSIDLNCLQHIFVMNRPDNIPTLKQIIGRGVRNKSHSYLPKSMQKVNVYLVTSCLPNNQKSIEEVRYLDKLKEYEEIQKIEKIMHEYAFDASLFYDIMEKEYDKTHDDLTEFSALKYKPATKSINYKLQDLNTSTYNVYYAKEEVEMIKHCIKQLFLLKSQVYTYADLWNDVLDYPFKINMKTEYFSESNFKIALYLLVNYKSDTYVKPPITFNIQNSYVIPYNNEIYGIYAVGEFYVLSKMSSNIPVDVECCYRFDKIEFENRINLDSYLRNRSTNIDYKEYKIRFKYKYQFEKLENLYNVVCDFGLEFHKQFIEDIIKYVFTIYTFADAKVTEDHDFYFKMLYYYDLIGVIFWANTVKNHIYDKYRDYLLESVKIEELKHVLDKTKCSWCPENIMLRYTASISKQSELTKSTHKSTTSQTETRPKVKIKCNPEVLPVGYILGDAPRFYYPDSGWLYDPEYLTNYEKTKENNIIIGYDEKTEAGIHVKFKIRNPVKITKSQASDKRLVEKGGECRNRSRLFLEDLIKRLGGKLPAKNNIFKICDEIKALLINKEIDARKNKTGIKWFYFYYEPQPT
jgi:hypothetical protein